MNLERNIILYLQHTLLFSLNHKYFIFFALLFFLIKIKIILLINFTIFLIYFNLNKMNFINLIALNANNNMNYLLYCSDIMLSKLKVYIFLFKIAQVNSSKI